MNKLNKVDKKYELIGARYKLSLLEQKLVLSIISKIRPSDADFMHYQIPINELDFLVDNENHKRLRPACKSLMSKPLEIWNDEEDWIMFNWFSHIKYKNGLLECSISPKLKPYLIQLKKNFKSYDLRYILNMESTYSIRIYELLKQWEKIGYKIYNLEELQDILQVPDSFKRYDNFKRKVLQIAGLELAKHSDIYFDFEEIKHGRKVVEIKFRIFKNKHNLIADEDYQLTLFRKKIIEEYEGKILIHHHKLDRDISIQNGLLVIEESGTIIKKENALELWKYIYKNEEMIKKSILTIKNKVTK